MRKTKLPSEARLALMAVVNRETIGQRIAARRKELDLSQEELAEKVGVRSQTVSRWERGLNLGRLGNLDQVASGLGITVATLMEGLEEDDENGIAPPVTETDRRLGQVEDEIAALSGDIAKLDGQVSEVLDLLRRLSGEAPAEESAG